MEVRALARCRLATTKTALLSALSVCQNIEISYPTIYRIVKYELRGKLKVPRPIHEKQKSGIIKAFKNHFPTRIKGLINEIREKCEVSRPISYWFQDETRLGYRTKSGQKITRVGVKPKQILQWHYSYYYIYSLVNPVKGTNFFSEFSHFNSDCLGLFLEQFAQEYQDKIHIIQLDNASVHTAHKLTVPENVILLFQPPRSLRLLAARCVPNSILQNESGNISNKNLKIYFLLALMMSSIKLLRF